MLQNLPNISRPVLTGFLYFFVKIEVKVQEWTTEQSLKLDREL